MEAKERVTAELTVFVVMVRKRDRKCGRINYGHWSLSALVWVMRGVRVTYGKKSGLLYTEAEDYCTPRHSLKKPPRSGKSLVMTATQDPFGGAALMSPTTFSVTIVSPSPLLRYFSQRRLVRYLVGLTNEPGTMAASPYRGAKREDAEAFLRAYACDNPSGDSILHLAVRKNDVELVQHLLKSKLPVHLRNDESKTPLHLAAELGLTNIGALLGKSGAWILDRQQDREKTDADSDSETDRYESVGSGDDATAQQPNKIVQRRDNPKLLCPLEIALDRGHQELIEALLKHAFPVKMTPSEEYNTLRLMAKAYVKDQEKTIEAFRKAGWSIDRKHSRLSRSFLHYVCEETEDVGPVDRLLTAGADPRGADLGGATVLHVAAQLGRCNDGTVVKRLIEAGARVNAADRVWNGVPLASAVQGQKIANVRVLIEAGADVNHFTEMKGMRRSILHLAAQDGIPEIIQLLLDGGANPNALDEEGVTTARFAVASKDTPATLTHVPKQMN